MSFIREDSLAGTLDALDQAWFDGQEIAAADRLAAARWIAARQGQPGAYAGMSAPMPQDYAHLPALFTGEPVKSQAGVGFVLGQEALRALRRLNVAEPEVSAAFDRARQGMLQRLAESEASGGQVGTYCCSRCSSVLWRSLAAGGLPDAEERLVSGLQSLRQARDGSGKWRRFPFYYTLLVLSEIGPALAGGEMHYAAPAAERAVRRSVAPDDRFGQRRRRVAEKLLAMC